MSFLLEEDELTGLQEVLAFVDASLAADADARQDVGLGPTAKRQRREGRAASDARRRLRKKEEAQSLRQEVAQLESRLRQLQDTSNLSRVSSHLPVKKRVSKMFPNDARTWQERAVDSRQQRVEAELVNRKLRKALASERGVLKALCATLDARRPPDDDVVLVPAPRSVLQLQQSKIPRTLCYDIDACHVDPIAVGLELHAMVEKMHQSASFVFESPTEPPSISSSFYVHLDPVLGPSPELKSVTPIGWGFPKAQQLIGAKLRRQNPTDSACTRTVKARVVAENGAVHKRLTVEVGGLRLDAFACMRQYRECDRVLLVWTAVCFHKSGSFCIREHGVIMVSRSPANPTQESVVQIHYGAHSEKSGEGSRVNGEDIDKVRWHAVRTIGEHWQKRTLLHQKAMLTEIGREDLASFVVV